MNTFTTFALTANSASRCIEDTLDLGTLWGAGKMLESANDQCGHSCPRKPGWVYRVIVGAREDLRLPGGSRSVSLGGCDLDSKGERNNAEQGQVLLVFSERSVDRIAAWTAAQQSTASLGNIGYAGKSVLGTDVEVVPGGQSGTEKVTTSDVDNSLELPAVQEVQRGMNSPSGMAVEWTESSAAHAKDKRWIFSSHD
jgi:hypothetical protein